MPEKCDLPEGAKAAYGRKKLAAGAALLLTVVSLAVWNSYPDWRPALVATVPAAAGLWYAVFRGFPCPRCSRGMWKAGTAGRDQGEVELRCRHCDVDWATGDYFRRKPDRD